MAKLRHATLILLLVPLLGSLSAFSGCASKLKPREGTCERVTSSAVLNCDVDAADAEIDPWADVPPLVGYVCQGSVRPDDSAVMIEDVPNGRICTDRGPIGDTGQRKYCCTDYDTPCAYNPTADCPETPNSSSSRYGFECRGQMRPEMFNQTIYCDQATRTDTLVNYCCNEKRLTWGCRPSNGCPRDLTAWNCDPGVLPRSQELTVSKSRADTYYMTCATPKQNTDTDQTLNYCCYTPSIIPDGGTCTQHTSVPGCATGRFGFACVGPESPSEDFPPMVCAEAGMPGTSMEGYPATLYCCDFVN